MKISFVIDHEETIVDSAFVPWEIVIDSKLPQQYHFITAWVVTIVVVAQQLETLRAN